MNTNVRFGSTPTTDDEMNRAIMDVEIAQNQFDNTLPEYVKAATLKLAAAIERLNVLTKQKRLSQV